MHTMTEMREDAALLSDFNMPVYSSDCTPKTSLEIPLRDTDMKSQRVQSGSASSNLLSNIHSQFWRLLALHCTTVVQKSGP